MMKNTKQSLRKIVFYIFLAIVCGMIVFPFYWMVATSLTKGSMYSYPPSIFPIDISIQSYISVFLERPMLRWIINTSIVSAVVIPATILIALPAAYSLSRFKYRGKGLVSQLILVTQMIPATLIIIPVFLIFSKLQLTNTLYSLMILDTAFAVPISIWISKGFFDTIPFIIEEAAFIDGCNHFGVLFRIDLPLILPGLVTVILLTFLTVWHEFVFAITLVQSEELRVVSIGLRYFKTQYFVPWNQLMAAAAIITIPIVIIFLGLEKMFVRGLTAGAVIE